MLVVYANKNDTEIPYTWTRYVERDLVKADKFKEGCEEVFKIRAESDKNARLHQCKHGNDMKKFFVGKGRER